MRIAETKVYRFDELSEDAKQKAIENNRFINVEYFDWWHLSYDHFYEMSIKVNEFDLDRKSISIEVDDFFEGLNASKDFGKGNAFRIIFENYQKEHDALVSKYSDGVKTNEVHEDNYDIFDDRRDDLDEEYRKELGQECLSRLNNEYEYLVSDEYLIERLSEEDMEFTEDGNNW
jgi:hypothetical protein